MKQFRNLLKRLRRVFKPESFSYLVDGKYRAELAFIHNDVPYYWFPNQLDLPTGRGLAALAIYEEMRMKVDKEYLDLHCRAVDKILSDPKRIDIGALALIHRNLKERSELMMLPDYIFKLASVVFFTKDEPTFSYDWKFNEQKIAAWKRDGVTLGFFLTTPLVELIPLLKLPHNDIQTYSQTVEKIDALHRSDLTAVLYNKK